MTNKSLLGIMALALSTFAVAGPKTYDLVVSNTVKAGDAQLEPGEYKLRVEGSNAVFTDTQTGKSITLAVKVENADKKYDSTALDTTKQGAIEQLTSIELGGSKIKLEFAH
jgi:hypothetical protein